MSIAALLFIVSVWVPDKINIWYWLGVWSHKVKWFDPVYKKLFNYEK